MKTETEIRERMKYLEDNYLNDPETGEPSDEAFMDEGQQAEYYTLSWVVGDEDY